MSVYGIAGYSGSGKSTTTEKLGHLSMDRNGAGTKIISGDLCYINSIWNHRTDAVELFGSEVFHPNRVASARVMLAQPEKYLKFREPVIRDVRELLLRRLEQYDRAGQDVLIDWIYTPCIEDICDKTILVDTAPVVRHARLLKRSPEHNRTMGEILQRDVVLDEMYRDFVPDYTVSNNEDMSADDMSSVENLGEIWGAGR